MGRRPLGLAHPMHSCWVFILLLLATHTSASSCDSGILQMKPVPQEWAECFSGPELSPNSIKAICGLAFRVRVKNGIVKIVPLQLGSYNYSYDAYMGPAPPPILFNCKDHNASGLLASGSTTSASVMLYDDFGGPLSNFSKTGPNQISLSTAHTYGMNQITPCVFNYTVAEGCVFGIKAAAKPPAACPVGSYRTTGRFGKSFCAPCQPGTYASTVGAPCKPCPRGMYAPFFGATSCKKCETGTYAATEGSAGCLYCSSSGKEWTDGTQPCSQCPEGSRAASDNKPQCFKCQAGVKCCTVGWGADCPKCAEGASSGSISSVFALESTSPSSCLATGHALCAPKINITVDGTCAVSLNNLNNKQRPDLNTYCAWDQTTSVPVQGARLSVADIAKFSYWNPDSNSSLLVGNFTRASSPYLDVYIPATKCTLRYRALTSPVAAVLGAAPKPGKAKKCPAGQYLETQTDAKPGPCLPCPLGTFSKAPSSGRPCTPCPAGTYTNRYGSVKCKKCPAGWVSKQAGASTCEPCPNGRLAASGAKSCVACPKGSGGYYSGASSVCLKHAVGNICCAAGKCKGQAPCKGALEPGSKRETYTAIFQVVSQMLPQPACRNATYLMCLPIKGKLMLTAKSSNFEINLDLYKTKFSCSQYNNKYINAFGGYTGSNAAYVTTAEDPLEGESAYGLLSDPGQGTVSMYATPAFSNGFNIGLVPIKKKPECSITLRLLSGYAFDLKPPAGAKCDPLLDVDVVYQGRKFCSPCFSSQFKNSKGKCQSCARGYYGKEWAGICKPCPAGYSCSSGWKNACSGGSYSSKTKQSTCSMCPANTYGSTKVDAPNKRCTPCPKGTIAPAGARACGVPWDMSFPA